MGYQEIPRRDPDEMRMFTMDRPPLKERLAEILKRIFKKNGEVKETASSEKDEIVDFSERI